MIYLDMVDFLPLSHLELGHVERLPVQGFRGGPSVKFTEIYPESYDQWVNLREHLPETIDFPMKNGIVL